MSTTEQPDLSPLDDTREVTRRFTQAVRRALEEHREAGDTVATWQAGKVVLVPASQLDMRSFDAPLSYGISTSSNISTPVDASGVGE